MKNVLVIGIGMFGYFAARKYAEEGLEVMAVDISEEAVNKVMEYVTSVQIGDCTNAKVLESIGVDNFDICLVAVSSNFQASLEITSLVKEMGAPYVISDAVVYPNREIANQIAVRTSTDSKIFDSIELSSEYSIYEVTVPEEWVGKSILQLNIRRKYRLNILGTKVNDLLIPMPDADYQFSRGEHIMLLGTKKDISKLL